MKTQEQIEEAGMLLTKALLEMDMEDKVRLRLTAAQVALGWVIGLTDDHGKNALEMSLEVLRSMVSNGPTAPAK